METSSSVKSFKDLRDMISFAKQCISQDVSVEEYTIQENIRKVLRYININALILTRNNFIIKAPENISNIVFCHDDIDCIFINNKYNYILYYSPNNNSPSLLIQRFLSIHYSNSELVLLTHTNNKNQLYNITNWICVSIFVATTSIHKECNSTELTDIVLQQYNDNEFRRMFDELCNVVISNQSNIIRIDTTRPSCVNNLTRKASQNLNKILEILYEIVNWSCGMIKEDENVRNTKLYCKLKNSSIFETVKKHIKISRTMVYETIIKFWNRLNYELTLNVDNVQLIKKTFQNIMYCLNTHYKYLKYVLINLLQSNEEDNLVSLHSFIIMQLTEEYDEKINNLTQLADDMNILICDVIKHCSK